VKQITRVIEYSNLYEKLDIINLQNTTFIGQLPTTIINDLYLRTDELETEWRWVAVSIEVLRDGLDHVTAGVDVDGTKIVENRNVHQM
jgi:hypothetical protein